MATKKKMLQAAAGNAGGAGLDVEEVFSTYLYEGNGSTQTITNGIDLDGEGGLVWTKLRSNTASNNIIDTVRGRDKVLYSDSTLAQQTSPGAGDDLTSFNTDGFSIGANYNCSININGSTYASWTFRKAPKFFDVVTYTGDGVEGRTVSHNLGVAPAFIIIKKTNSSEDWLVGTDFTSTDFKNLKLNTTDAATTQAYASPYNSFAAQPSSTEITLSFVSTVNGSGDTYVAYLFAHNDGDGEFGPDGDADIIKCGSYSGNGSTDGPEIDLGFEPQWLMVKRADSTSGWSMWDSMRGVVTGGSDQRLYANESNAEATTSGDDVYFTATGFGLGVTYPYVNASGGTYIYIAIRRGTKVPESATEVFEPTVYSSGSDPSFSSSFPVDMAFWTTLDPSTNRYISTRLTQGTRLRLNDNTAEAAQSGHTFDYMDGWLNLGALSSNYASWMWKRAPGFFDVVAYTGDGTAGRTVSHNLGVAPEMMWVKRRNAVDGWTVYHSGFDLDGDGLPETDYGALDNGNHFDGTLWNDTAPTATEFTVGFQGAVNDTFNNNYIAYLFATLPGISKVGSYTGNGTSQTIDCGFTSGSRFVLIKRSDLVGGYGTDWYVWDTERGIVAANDPHLSLNTTAAEVTTDDSIDPDSSGFIVNQVAATNINVSSAEYIFYAVA